MVFLGTPAAAVPALLTLSRRTDVSLVITRGDRRRGRSFSKSSTEVKKAAMELGLATSCPESRVELLEALRSAGPIRLGVVVAYGMLLTRPMLDLAEMGFVNVHFSLLPRWRGAAPVAAAIRAGDSLTGVSLMSITEGLDSGPVLAAASAPVRDTDDRGGLTVRLSHLGAELISEKLSGLLAGKLRGTPQREEDATYAPRLTSEDARLDFGRSVEDLARQVRSLAPRPGAFTWWCGQRMRILQARWSPDPPMPLGVGELTLVAGDLWCGGRGGGLILDGIQLAGKRVMPGWAWANGVQGGLGSLGAG